MSRWRYFAAAAAEEVEDQFDVTVEVATVGLAIKS